MDKELRTLGSDFMQQVECEDWDEATYILHKIEIRSSQILAEMSQTPWHLKNVPKLTDDEKRITIAKACGGDRWFVLKKRGLFYRLGGSGYTALESEAWKLTDEEADKHVYPHDTPVAKHAATLPDYLNDLNAMHEAEKCLESDKQIEYYLDNLTNVCGGDTPVGRASFTAYFATAAQRADAFLLTINATPGKPDSSP